MSLNEEADIQAVEAAAPSTAEPQPPADPQSPAADAVGSDDGLHESPAPISEHEILVLLQCGGGSISRELVQDIIAQLGGLSAPRKVGSSIDVWLESPGGDAHAAFKLGLYLRARFERVNFVVMDYAKSAATLLSLAADKIYMAPAAELGPLDIQETREGEVRLRSMLDTADSIDTLFSQAVTNAVTAGGWVLASTGLTREKTIAHLLSFAGDFMRPLLEQLDPIAINAANTGLLVASEYGARLLAYKDGKDDIDEARRQVQRLVRGYPTHGYVIDRQEAKTNLRLPVEDVENYPLLAQAENMYSQVEKSKINFVQLLPVSTFVPTTPNGDEQDGQQDHSDGNEPTQRGAGSADHTEADRDGAGGLS